MANPFLIGCDTVNLHACAKNDPFLTLQIESGLLFLRPFI